MNELPCDFPWGSTRYANSQLYHTKFLTGSTPQDSNLGESSNTLDIGQRYHGHKDKFKGISPNVLALNKAKLNLLTVRFRKWQLKIFREDTNTWIDNYRPQVEDTKRTDRYLALKGIGDLPYLPNIPDVIANGEINLANSLNILGGVA